MDLSEKENFSQEVTQNSKRESFRRISVLENLHSTNPRKDDEKIKIKHCEIPERKRELTLKSGVEESKFKRESLKPKETLNFKPREKIIETKLGRPVRKRKENGPRENSRFDEIIAKKDHFEDLENSINSVVKNGVRKLTSTEKKEKEVGNWSKRKEILKLKLGKVIFQKEELKKEEGKKYQSFKISQFENL